MGKLNLVDRFHHWRRKMRWNKQYRKGKWDYLNNQREAKRYDKIIEYIKTHGKTKPIILDLGAGEAILNDKLNDTDYSFFFNVDFSKASIDKAKVKQLKNANDVVADIHTYNPKQSFDIIVFNEAFYYVHNNLKVEVLNRFVNKLNPKGILIVSIYKEGQDCWDIINASSQLELLNFETVTTDREKTYWKVGAYKKL